MNAKVNVAEIVAMINEQKEVTLEQVRNKFGYNTAQIIGVLTMIRKTGIMYENKKFTGVKTVEKKAVARRAKAAEKFAAAAEMFKAGIEKQAKRKEVIEAIAQKTGATFGTSEVYYKRLMFAMKAAKAV